MEDMSSKPKRSGNPEAEASPTQAGTGEVPVGAAAHEEKIRSRAYQIYLERGEQHGRDLDDWLQAKREFEDGARWPEQAG
jgi:hypothetical protein